MSRRTAPVASPPALRTVCAWCGADLRPGAEPTSYGICPPCKRRVLAELVSAGECPP